MIFEHHMHFFTSHSQLSDLLNKMLWQTLYPTHLSFLLFSLFYLYKPYYASSIASKMNSLYLNPYLGLCIGGEGWGWGEGTCCLLYASPLLLGQYYWFAFVSHHNLVCQPAPTFPFLKFVNTECRISIQLVPVQETIFLHENRDDR
jgi:hypothetical protein